ncbi:MAG: DUF4189 domain-containing protein [Pseudomonadota bacterium]
MLSVCRIVLCLAVIGFGSSLATPALADWMSYAMDDRGAVGHGRAPTRRAAENFALSYCGNANCRVADTTQVRCMAFAESRYNGYFAGIGRAHSDGQAKSYALDWCSRGAPVATCQIRHAYCSHAYCK